MLQILRKLSKLVLSYRQATLSIRTSNYSKGNQKKDEANEPSANYNAEKHKCCEKKPPIECCRQRKREPDPNLSRFGGKPFKTCGPNAYVIQHDTIPRPLAHESDETKILKKIEADPTVKRTVHDPMPPFQSVEQRLLDLCERGLHPFYRRYMALPKPSDYQKAPNRMAEMEEEEGAEGETGEEEEEMTNWYHCLQTPISVDDFPKQLRQYRDLLERKSIYADYKIAELPRQMVVRMLEIEKNRQPTIDKIAEMDGKVHKKRKIGDRGKGGKGATSGGGGRKK